jgi:hypothetical protein
MEHQSRYVDFIAKIFLICAVFVSGAVSAQASENRQQLVYEVYAGGLHAVQATLDINLSEKGRYELFMDAHTRGLLGSLAPWSGTFLSRGWVLKNDEYRPELHQSTATWRDEDKIKNYNYSKNGGFKSIVVKDHDKPEETEIPEAELTQDTTDILTATLYTLSTIGSGGVCEDSHDVFDGKRRFTMTFKGDKQVDLKASKYNIYEGPAIECLVEVKPGAGKWHSKPRGWLSIQEQGRDKGKMPTVWFGKIVEGLPAIPVKIRVKTDYGTLFMHLVEYKSADKILITENRAKKADEE